MSLFSIFDCRFSIAGCISKRQSKVANSSYWPHAVGRGIERPLREVEREIDHERSAQQQPLGNHAPGAAVGACRTVVAEAQIMARLDIEEAGRQSLQVGPFCWIAVSVASQAFGVLETHTVGVVSVAPEAQ